MVDISLTDFASNLLQWFRTNGYVGYDPYQLNGIRRLMAKYGCSKSATFGLKKLFIPKAIGLIIRGNICRYNNTRDKSLIPENEKLIQSLIDNRFSSYQNPAWGWPFVWGLPYPKDYPLSVVTAEIGHAFLDHYEISPSPELKATCEKIAKALIDEIGFGQINDEQICFYYTNMDKYFVINCSTYAASYLARLHSIVPNKSYKELSLAACKFALSCQQNDGSWYYYAPPWVEKNKTIDNRHTGFTIVSLLWANRLLKERAIEEAVAKGWEFYRKNFVSDYRPKYYLTSLFPVDMHNIAQLIITAVELGDRKLAEGCAQWAIEKMSNGKNEFYYRMYQDGTIITIPFFRWNQAWMYRALTMLSKQ